MEVDSKIKLQSRIDEWVDGKNPVSSRVDPNLSACKDFSDDIEVGDINPESHKVFQNSCNKFSKFKLRLRCLWCTKSHGDDADYFQMRGENFCPEWLNERIKKWNSEYGDKPNKPINFLPPPPMKSTATTSVSQDKTDLL